MKHIACLLILMCTTAVFSKTLTAEYKIFRVDSLENQSKYTITENRVLLNGTPDTTGLMVFEGKQVLDFMQASIVSYAINEHIFIPTRLKLLADTIKLYTEISSVLDSSRYNHVEDSIQTLEMINKVTFPLSLSAVVLFSIAGGAPSGQLGYTIDRTILTPKTVTDSLVIDTKTGTVVATSLKVSKAKISNVISRTYNFRELQWSIGNKELGDFFFNFSTDFFTGLLPMLHVGVHWPPSDININFRYYLNNLFDYKFKVKKFYYSIGYQIDKERYRKFTHSTGLGIYYPVSRCFGYEGDVYYSFRNQSFKKSYIARLSLVVGITLGEMKNWFQEPIEPHVNEDMIFKR
ncbi:MAG: hypothetical protein OCD01_05100 [Fibrobacterales bacterium]